MPKKRQEAREFKQMERICCLNTNGFSFCIEEQNIRPNFRYSVPIFRKTKLNRWYFLMSLTDSANYIDISIEQYKARIRSEPVTIPWAVPAYLHLHF